MAETRALLITDVVDSTTLAEELGEARTAALWTAHDRVARDLLVPRRGREIDKTDGFLLLFESAGDAAAYALEYHRAIARLDPPLSARAGLHVGEVVLTENAPADVARGAKPLEVAGVAKHVVARVMSVALGGQTLVTPEARAVLLDTGLRLESHGHWRLKGLARPLELFEVGDAASPWRPPPDGAKAYRVVADGELWLPARQVRHVLPAERDAFVGRHDDLLELARRLDEGARLVTVLGLGGTGKTRLVTHFAWTWLGDYPGGAWFCDLSEARSVEGICSAVARALDVPLGQDDPVVQLGHALAARGACLVVLDNFEQVARHADATLGRWLDRAAEARFIVTSREVLGLPGESALALSPLRPPDATTLFLRRAEASRRDFRPTPDDLAAIALLVVLLDGLPLAVELAAARVRVMPPRALVERMDERFKLLTSTGARRDRQATLRGALDWSWDLLTEPERAALAQLSVFEGAFTLESAEEVLDLAPWPDAPLGMDVVQSLVDKSLVRRAGDERFDLLVSVQEYAAEALRQPGRFATSGPEAALAAEARHGACFAARGTDDALAALESHGGTARRNALALELDDLVAACRRALARGDASRAALAHAAAWSVLELRGPFDTAIELGHAVLAATGLDDSSRLSTLQRLGLACQAAGRNALARERLEAALELARDRGDRRRECELLGQLGDHHRRQGRMTEARTLCEQALFVARQTGHRTAEGTGASYLGALHWSQGRIEEALACLAEALAVHRETGNRRREGVVLGNVGILLQQQGRHDEALASFDAALALHREVGNRRAEGDVEGFLGILHASRGDRVAARARFEAALAIHREVGDRSPQGNDLCNIGILLAEQGLVKEADAPLGDALVVHREVGNRRGECTVLDNLARLRVLEGRLDLARETYEAALALARSLGNRVAEGRITGSLGAVARRQGRLDDARALHEAALALHRAAGSRREEGQELARLALVHALQGREEEARAALEAGEALLHGDHDETALALLACRRAECARLAGDADAARLHLDEAELRAEGLPVGAGSELGEALAALREALR